MQAPFSHFASDAQSASALHVVVHAVAPQTYGAHAFPTMIEQEPMPLQA
jgi:hypothetical protein